MTEQTKNNHCGSAGRSFGNLKPKLKNPKQKLGKDFTFSDDETNTSGSELDLIGMMPHMKPPKCHQTPLVSNYINRLHKELDCLQKSFLSLSRQYTRMKFKVRQIVEAKPEHRERLITEMQRYAYSSDEETEEKDAAEIALEKLNPAELRARQSAMITQLRQRLNQLVEVSHVYSHAAPPNGRVSVMSKDKLSNYCFDAETKKHHFSKEAKKYAKERNHEQNSTRIKKSGSTQGQPYAKPNEEKKSKRKS